ncbi:putative acetyltransferase [Glycine soja]|uniref:Putative acetyltransferase n=2 Tax=Glycine soja TaxID=3848 RepID=A0A445FNF9_GLYSO|nr:putative acetyltransferase [Glycine soja]
MLCAKMSYSSSAFPSVVSKCTVVPHRNSTMGDLKLSISDLNMLLSHYIQKGCLFTTPSLPSSALIPHLKNALSQTLSLFPPLAGRLKTDADGYVYITCNDTGVDFIHVTAADISVADLLSPSSSSSSSDVPPIFKQLFPFHHKISYTAHSSPIMAFQVTDLADGIFLGCAVCHAVTDGASFWNFFNTFAGISRGATTSPSTLPDFRRESILNSNVVLRLPEEIKVTFNVEEPFRERIFSFSRESIQELKATVNNNGLTSFPPPENGDAVELMAKMSNDTQPKTVTTTEISSFQSLCALVWRCVTKARNIEGSKTTTFRMAVNVRQRLEPKLGDCYFGNAIQSIAACAEAADVASKELRWCAEQLNKSVKAFDSATVHRNVENWERQPKCFELGNHDGATVQMGSSPRFPMYDNDFGWGRPLAVRSGGANKFDGKMSAFPGRNGGGAVDLEVVLAPDTMARLESDSEFMFYVSG